MLLTLVLAGSACLAVAVVVLLAVVVIAVRGEDRRMSLKAGPATRLEAATRRLLGVGIRQPKDQCQSEDDFGRFLWAGRR
jgi:hypothetical protein